MGASPSMHSFTQWLWGDLRLNWRQFEQWVWHTSMSLVKFYRYLLILSKRKLTHKERRSHSGVSWGISAEEFLQPWCNHTLPQVHRGRALRHWRNGLQAEEPSRWTRFICFVLLLKPKCSSSPLPCWHKSSHTKFKDLRPCERHLRYQNKLKYDELKSNIKFWQEVKFLFSKTTLNLFYQLKYAFHTLNNSFFHI
jgi:hypothetical protein